MMNESDLCGSALGPDWMMNLDIKGNNHNSKKTIKIEYKCEVKQIMNFNDYQLIMNERGEEILDDDKFWPIYVELTNSKIYGCDFIISATGITPSIDAFIKNNKFEVAVDGGLKVNDKMETNIQNIYAAGDVCTADWKAAPFWFQMVLINHLINQVLTVFEFRLFF
jgi:pyridine nucleotide-disulfide oxidoreductase domain-containing protein 1